MQREMQYDSVERYVKHGSKRYRIHKVTDPAQDLIWFQVDRVGLRGGGKRRLHAWPVKLSTGEFYNSDEWV